MQEISIISPATVANVVCGFDCLGFALEKPFDEMTVRLINEQEVRIINRDDFGLPVEPEKNVAGVVLLSVLRKITAGFGFEVELTKHIKPGSGLGSSAASAAGAAFAANFLLEDRFSKAELVELAMDGEQLAGGARHADNVAPVIYGGFTLVRSNDPVDVVPLDFPPMFVTIIHPQIEIKTSAARALLKPEIPLKTAVRQWGNVGALVAGLARGDYDLIARSLEDLVAEPFRKVLIPNFDELKNECIEAGALGGGISGSGPSVFMLSETMEKANEVEKVMRSVYDRTEIDFHTYVSKINAGGAKCI